MTAVSPLRRVAHGEGSDSRVFGITALGSAGGSSLLVSPPHGVMRRRGRPRDPLSWETGWGDGLLRGLTGKAGFSSARWRVDESCAPQFKYLGRRHDLAERAGVLA